MENPVIEDQQSHIEKRNLLLKDVDPHTIRKAWFTLAHLLLDEGARVVDMGCGDGTMTYAMAVLEPKVKFTGLDKSRRNINKAREQYELHNLDFKTGDASSEIFEPNSLDAIINSYVLHEVYSGSRYNERIVSDTLGKQFKMLKRDGIMFIRDYARPPPEEFVLMEMPDKESAGRDLAGLSEADLLVWYSEHARPRQDAGCGGFFLEELPERFPGTRLFRLPYKWAYEFIMRKDDRAHWEKELPMEYTFFTEREFRKELRALGARAQYSAPYWDEDIIAKKFEGHFNLYTDTGVPLGHPPTSHIVVARKMAERKSLHIHERRPSTTDDSKLQISALRNEKTGQILDVVTPEEAVCEIIPYRIDEEERLKIYLHDGVARSIVNSVPRSGLSLDQRRWSGHMVEPVAIEKSLIDDLPEFDVKHSVLFARDHLGLKPQANAVIEKGPDYYPAPSFIDEQIFTYYLKVEQAKGHIAPKKAAAHVGKFQARGVLRELDAQQVLDAITVGMIPSARLEMQILSLFQHLGIRAETWTNKQVAFQAGKLTAKKSLRKLLDMYGTESNRFKNVKGSAGELRPVHSIFVEEGQSRGAMAGLSAQDVDFVVYDDKTINTAVVLPLTMGLKGDIHAGFSMDHLPVPERKEGNGLSISAPSFDLPREITNMKMAKKFIAEKFGVLPELVLKLGESYFTHIGVTQQKIHPFAVTVPPHFADDPETHFLPFYQMMLLRRSLGKDPHFMSLIARAYRYFHDDLRLDAQLRVRNVLKERFAYNLPEWSIPLNYTPGPSIVQPKAVEIADIETKDKLDQKIAEKKADQALQKPAEAAETEQAQAKPSPPASPEKAPDLLAEFEMEMEEFLEELENENAEPRPEKW